MSTAPAPAPMVPAEPVAYAQASWRALGTYVELVVAHAPRLPAAREIAERTLDEIDLACSRFRDDSDLVRANAAAGTWVEVSPLLVQAVEVAVEAARRSDGLVDPTLGLSLVAAGYDADLPLVQTRGAGPADVPPLPARSGAWREVLTQAPDRLLVPFDVALDLGATGKAFAADLVAARIAAGAGTDCVISVGGDVAVGAVDGSPGHAWQVLVCETPEPGPQEPTQLVTLPSGGLATSTTVHRRWTHGRSTMHHLLDPATGRPVERTWRTASVLADTCVEANTASTASIVLGERAPQWLADRGLAARLTAKDGTVVTVGAWPTDVTSPSPGAEGHTGAHRTEGRG